MFCLSVMNVSSVIFNLWIYLFDIQQHFSEALVQEIPKMNIYTFVESSLSKWKFNLEPFHFTQNNSSIFYMLRSTGVLKYSWSCNPVIKVFTALVISSRSRVLFCWILLFLILHIRFSNTKDIYRLSQMVVYLLLTGVTCLFISHINTSCA